MKSHRNQTHQGFCDFLSVSLTASLENSVLMIDVFFEHVADAGFSRGYGQKSHFFTLANFMSFGKWCIWSRAIPLKNFVPVGKWNTDVKFHQVRAFPSKKGHHKPQGVAPLSSEHVRHEVRHWTDLINWSLSDIADEAYTAIVHLLHFLRWCHPFCC